MEIELTAKIKAENTSDMKKLDAILRIDDLLCGLHEFGQFLREKLIQLDPEGATAGYSTFDDVERKFMTMFRGYL